MRTALRFALIATAASLALSGCGNLHVERLEPGVQTDLSGAWNDTDARQVAQRLVGDLRGHRPPSARSRPTLLIGLIHNQGAEAVVLSSLERWLETELVQSGDFDVVAGGRLRDELRDERRSQQQWASTQTQTALAEELGAEYMLQGTLHTWEEREGRRTVRTYRIDAYVVHLESTRRTWAGSHEIKKQIDSRWLGL